MEKKRKDVTSCGCLVYRRNGDSFEVLLVKPFRDREAWGAPKGHIDEGETFEECAKREVLEETGLKVVVGSPLPLCHTKNHHENKTVRIYLATAENSDGPLVGDGENADMRWFALDNLPNLHKYQDAVIRTGVKEIEVRLLQEMTVEKLGTNFFMDALSSDRDT